MDKQLFATMLEEEFDRIREIWSTKGEEYTRSDDDQLINFKRRGAEAGIRPAQAWLVLAGKHWDSIVSYVHDGHVKSEEPIEARIRDEVLYLFLLMGLAREAEAAELLEAAK